MVKMLPRFYELRRRVCVMKLGGEGAGWITNPLRLASPRGHKHALGCHFYCITPDAVLVPR